MKQEVFDFLQFFAEAGEESTENESSENEGTENEEGTKTFSQKELDEAIEARLRRERKAKEKEIQELKEKLEANEKEKRFSKLNEDERKAAELEDKLEKYNNELAEKNAELLKLRAENRVSEIITEYSKDGLPCSDLFVNIAPTIARIDDEEVRSKVYMDLKALITGVQKDIKQEMFKNGTPNGSNKGSDGNNPFKNGNFTEISRLISSDIEKAKTLAKEVGVYNKYFK